MSSGDGSVGGSRRRVAEGVAIRVIAATLTGIWTRFFAPSNSSATQAPAASSPAAAAPAVGSPAAPSTSAPTTGGTSPSAAPAPTPEVSSAPAVSQGRSPATAVNAGASSGEAGSGAARLSLSELRPLNFPHWGGSARVATLGQTPYPNSYVANIAGTGACTDTWWRYSDYTLPSGYRTLEAHFGLADDSVDATTTAQVLVQSILDGGAAKQLYSSIMKVGVDTPAVIDIHGVKRLRMAVKFLGGTGSYYGCEEAKAVAGSPELVQ